MRKIRWNGEMCERTFVLLASSESLFQLNSSEKDMKKKFFLKVKFVCGKQLKLSTQFDAFSTPTHNRDTISTRNESHNF